MGNFNRSLQAKEFRYHLVFFVSLLIFIIPNIAYASLMCKNPSEPTSLLTRDDVRAFVRLTYSGLDVSDELLDEALVHCQLNY